MHTENWRVFVFISLSLLNLMFLIDGSVRETLEEIWEESWTLQDIYL